MKELKEQIKSGQFKPVYLLYGEEAYLKRFYKTRLVDAVLGEGDKMNYSYYAGKGIDEKQVVEMAETLPFFHDKRILVIENSGWFKNQSGMPDYMPRQPESTFFVFVETEVDKRSRMYKAVKERGTIAELGVQDVRELKVWVTQLLGRAEKKMTERTIEYLLDRVGLDMDNLSNEVEKLVCYAYDREIVTESDVTAVCSEQVTGKIFQMMEAIGMKKQGVALGYYYDLLSLRENPLSILFLTIRQFNIILQVKELAALHYDNKTIASKAGIPPFAVGKYAAQAKNFPGAVLKEALQYGIDIEERIKTGRIGDKVGVELLIVKYSM